MEVPGLAGRADGDPAHPAVADVVADLEAGGVAPERQGRLRVLVGEGAGVDGEVHGSLRVVVREEARVNGAVHGGQATCRLGPVLLDS
jgi:hypothetical protein